MRGLSRAAAAMLLLLASGGSAAAQRLAGAPDPTLAWSWDGWVLSSLGGAAFAYAFGAHRLHDRLGAARVLRWREVAAFAAGLATIFFTLESPLDAASDQLFCAHMAQHLLLMLVAAPLLVAGRPAIAFLWAFPPGGRKRIGRIWTRLGLSAGMRSLMHPLVVWLLFYGNFIIWHFPGPYQAALRNQAIHAGEHASFLLTALMFWSLVIEPSGRRRLGYGATFLYIVKTAVLSALPGALLALAHRPLYPIYSGKAALWGITALQDQQLAGLVMWIPGGFIWVVAAGLTFLKWLDEAEQRERALALTRRAALPLAAVLLLVPVVAGFNISHARPLSVVIGGNRAHGRKLIEVYGCGECHSIPGVSNASGLVGPPLTSFGRRSYIAGLLRNTPGNLSAWLRDPQRFVPGVVMPNMGLSKTDARDIAAYLESLR